MGKEIDWSEIPEDVTHYCPVQNLWYRNGPTGRWQYMQRSVGKNGWAMSAISSSRIDSLIARPVTPAIDWDKAPADATHCCVDRMVWYRLDLRGHLSYMDPRHVGTWSTSYLLSGAVSKLVPRPVVVDHTREGNVQLMRENARLGGYQGGYRAALAHHGLGPSTDTQALVPTPGYERLVAVLKAAHDQAAMGKGADRHANGLPFHKQRMQQISVLLDSPDGMAYQVAKKVAEGLDLPTHERQLAELYGAINYIAGIVIFLEDKEGTYHEPT